MKKYKYIISIVLSTIMLLAFLPIQVFASGSTLDLGDFDVCSKTFKDASGTGSDTYKCVAIYVGNEITSDFNIILPSGYSKSSDSDDYKIFIPLSEAQSASTIATDLLSKIVFDVHDEQDIRIELMAETPSATIFYNEQTQHYYTYINDKSKDWPHAYEAARAMTYNGRQGYLATITSLEEDAFVYEASGNKVGWLGGTRLPASNQDGQYFGNFDITGTETYWYWACGPEVGEEFFDVATVRDGSGEIDSTLENQINTRNATTNGYYFNWGPGEPSLGGGLENCLSTLATKRGYSTTSISNYSWNDISYNMNEEAPGTYTPEGYIVEFGDMSVGDSKPSVNLSVDAHIGFIIAKIDSDEYVSIKDAVEDVENNETIILLDDTQNEKIPVDREITFNIDSNGFENNVTITADRGYELTPPEKNGDVTTYALTALTAHNVTVNVNGSTMGTATADPSNAYKDETVTLTATPNEGYRFVKWESADVEASSGEFTMPDKDVTVTAVFEQLPDIPDLDISIEIPTEGDTSLPDVTLPSGAPFKLDETNSTFINETNGEPLDPSTMKAGDKVTVTLVFVADSGYVFSNDGTDFDMDSVMVNGETLPYFDDSDMCYLPMSSPTVFQIRYTFEVQEPTPDYEVIFKMGGHGTQVAPQTVKEGNKATEPTAPSEEGYSFDGWYTDSKFTSKFDFSSAITADTTLYAKWTSEITYAFEKNDILTWQLKSADNLNYVVHRSIDDSKTFSLFTGIQIDNQDVSADKYDAASGSLILNLKPSYLNTLTEGEHTLKVIFKDGMLSIRFVIKAEPTTPSPSPSPDGGLPKTGDSTSWTVVVGIVSIAGAVVLMEIASRKKREI